MRCCSVSRHPVGWCRSVGVGSSWRTSQGSGARVLGAMAAADGATEQQMAIQRPSWKSVHIFPTPCCLHNLHQPRYPLPQLTSYHDHTH